MNRVYHVTRRKNVPGILKDGFKGTRSDLPFGVAFWDSEWAARRWGTIQHSFDPKRDVILEVESDEPDSLWCFFDIPDDWIEDEDDPEAEEKYGCVKFVALDEPDDEDETVYWKPDSIRVIDDKQLSGLESCRRCSPRV